MNAAEFIAKFGWEISKAFLGNWSSLSEDYGFKVDDLKTYIDAYEFVQKKGGLTGAKRWLQTEESEPYYNYEQSVVDELKKNITLVEEVESLKEVC